MKPETAATRPSSDQELVGLAAELRVTMSRLGRRTRAANGGLTPSQLSALVTLDECGSLRLHELASREGVAAPTTSRSVDELAKRGLVERRADPDDARSAFISLTDRGRAVVGQAADERTMLLAATLGELDVKEIAAIKAAIPALRSLSGRPRDIAR
ncbi:MAG: MarR family winged helix-turn-helix transcriptional regulator [Acidothermaceae bacterium]